MIHKYKLNGFNIVLDVHSGGVHLVDELTYDILDNVEPPFAEECPEKIAIPELLALYNRKINGETVTDEDYAALTKESTPASCIKCKKCEKMCPQKIEIAGLMEKVSETFG